MTKTIKKTIIFRFKIKNNRTSGKILRSFISFLLFFLVTGINAFAQGERGGISGIISLDDNLDDHFAFVSMLTKKDSAIYKTISVKPGKKFAITNVPLGDYYLVVASLGYKPFIVQFNLTSQKTAIDFHEIKLINSNNLKEIIIKGETVPIVSKGDTIEVNTKNIKTQVNDNVEELLKKVPGLTIDQNGRVIAQGQQVKKILVDGREFFGNDIKAATKNLPADAIDKVQIIDDKTENTKNTGIDDGRRDKIINLKLKDDKKNGWFGNISFLTGTDKRYLGQFNINRFEGNRQISLLLLSNNINESGFSFEDLNNFTGGDALNAFASTNGSTNISSNNGRVNINGVFSGLDQGRLTNTTAGFNYSEAYGKKKKLTLNLNLIYINSSNFINQQTNVDDPANKLTSFQNKVGNQDFKSYRLGAILDYTLDSLTKLKFRPNIATSIRSDIFKTAYQSNNSNTGDTVNQISQSLIEKVTSPIYGGQLTVNRKLSNNSGSINLNAIGSYSSNQDSYINIYNSTYYQLGLTSTSTNENTTNDYTQNFLSSTLSYVKLINRKKKISLTLKQSYDVHKDQTNVNTVDYNLVTGKYDIYNFLYGGDLNNLSHRISTSAGLNLVGKKSVLNISASVANLGLNSDIFNNAQPGSININQWAFLPTANFSYRPRSGRTWNFFLITDATLPSAISLQPILNNTDPLYIRTGNPDLKMSKSYVAAFNYNSYDTKSGILLNLNGNFQLFKNAFSSSSTIDSSGVTMIKPINANGNYALTAGGNISKPTAIKGLKWNLGGNIALNRTQNVINSFDNIVMRFSPNISSGLTFDEKNIQTSIRVSVAYNDAENSYESTANQHYFTFYNVASISFLPQKNWRLSTDVTQNIYDGDPNKFQYYVWNFSVEHYFFEKRNFTVSLNCFDLLNQNSNIQRTINYTGQIQNTITNTIGRYFYIKLVYKISKAGNSNSK